MSIYNLRPYIGNFPLIGGYNLGPYIGGDDTVPLPIQRGVISWHNYTDPTKIIEGDTAISAAGWTDEVTPGFDSSQPTALERPTYTANKLTFDGNDSLSTGVSTMGTTGLFADTGEAWTVIVVAEYDGEGYSISKAVAGASTLRQLGIFAFAAETLSILIRGESTGLPGSYTFGDKIYIGVTWDGTDCLAYVDDEAPIALTVGTAPDDNISPIQVGQRVGGFNLIGSLYHRLIFDTTKSGSEMAELREYLDPVSARFIMFGASIIDDAWLNELTEFIGEVQTEFGKRILITQEGRQGGFKLAAQAAEIDATLASYPDPSTESFNTYCPIHIGGGDVSFTRPYSSLTVGEEADFTSDLDYVIAAIIAKGYIPILGDLTFRDYDNTTEASPENGSLPYNENIYRPRVASEFKYGTGKPWLQYYDMILADHATYLDGDNIHHTAAGSQAMRDHFKDTIVNYVLTGTPPTELI